VIRATAATWLNYATTIAFQILFAAAFGTSAPAGAFVVAFAVAVSVSGVFVTTATTNVLPRMIAPDGHVSGNGLRKLGAIGVVAMAAAIFVAATAPVTAGLVAPVVGVETEVMTALLLAGSVFLGTQAVSGVLGCAALIRGRRFWPALGPALPSTLGALYLAVTSGPTVTDAMFAVAVGGVVQVVMMGALALMPPLATGPGPALALGRIATLTAGLLLLMGLIPPLQRVMAAVLDPAGAAQFDYAARGMQVALQLLLGGLVIAVLPEWTVRYQERGAIHPEVTRVAAVATVLLFTAAGVALVAVEPIVRLVYERGAFLPADTEAVVLLARILVPGFVAEGLWLVTAQGLLASGRTDLVLQVWAVRFVVQLGLTLVLGALAGSIGVAVAYSASNLVATGFAALLARRTGIFHDGSTVLIRAFQVGAATGIGAVVLLLAAEWVPPLLAGAAVFAIAAVAGHVAGLTPAVMATLRGQPPQGETLG
jgi:putative peptidoglycan lipid II flippase